jgi:hypothetical protein
MRRLFLLLFIFQLSISSHAQVVNTRQSLDELALQRISLISDLQALDAKAGQLEKQLARAAAKAEIADAAWTLDTDWAKKLLQEAYELSFPSEEVQARLRQIPIDSPPFVPNAIERARDAVRQRVIGIASRDKAFAKQLAQFGAKQLGRWEEHQRYGELANSAVKRGDKEEASQYIRQAFEADPTQWGTWPALSELAVQDRAAADKIIIQYIERLRTTTLSLRTGSFMRVEFLLLKLLYPSPSDPETGGRQIQSPGPAVWRAYVNYMLDYITQDEQSKPGSLKYWRLTLLSLWPPIKTYAPELIERFKELEMLSRKPGEEASWPPPDTFEASKKQYKGRMKNLRESEEPDAEVIGILIDRGEFASARRILDKLTDGPQKTDLLNKLDAKEAISLVKKGDLASAQMLAGRLIKATYILQAYPVIIEKCISNKDKPCATNMVYQATRQLKQADVTPPTLPPGVPASVLADSREFDPVLSSLCKLAQLILPINDSLAFDVLNDMVVEANASEVDTGQGRAGFDAGLFKSIAQKDEMRARQSALSFKDTLRQVISLAAIYRWKAEELNTKAKTISLRSAAPANAP